MVTNLQSDLIPFPSQNCGPSNQMREQLNSEGGFQASPGTPLKDTLQTQLPGPGIRGTGTRRAVTQGNPFGKSTPQLLGLQG